MDQTDKPVANPIVVLREEFDDWAILYNPDTAAVVGINPVGVSVWKSLNGRKSLTEIVAEIDNRFEQVSAGAREEIGAFISTLAERGFVGYELQDHDRGSST